MCVFGHYVKIITVRNISKEKSTRNTAYKTDTIQCTGVSQMFLIVCLLFLNLNLPVQKGIFQY